MLRQVKASQYALQQGIAVGERWGIRHDDHYFSVQRTSASLLVWPQKETDA